MIMPQALFIRRQIYIVSFLLSVLVGCSTTAVFKLTEFDKTLTSQSVIAQPNGSLGKIVLWGGTILDIRNLKDSTQIEVLAYPIDSSFRPLLDSKPLGRFIILHTGYLEPTTYAQGGLISVSGSINKSQKGKIGDKLYTYPVVKSQQSHLWPANDRRSNTRFHFGIGISL